MHVMRYTPCRKVATLISAEGAPPFCVETKGSVGIGSVQRVRTLPRGRCTDAQWVSVAMVDGSEVCKRPPEQGNVSGKSRTRARGPETTVMVVLSFSQLLACFWGQFSLGINMGCFSQ